MTDVWKLMVLVIMKEKQHIKMFRKKIPKKMYTQQGTS